MFWETEGKEYQLLKEHWSSKREAQSITFPSYFLSELHLRKPQTFLPRCVPQNQHGSGRAYLAFWEPFLYSAWMQTALLSAAVVTAHCKSHGASSSDRDFQTCKDFEQS